MCRQLLIALGMSELVVIFSFLQALGISNKNTTEDINIRLKRDVPSSLEKEDFSQLILLFEFILFALILVLIIYLIRYLNGN